LEEDATRRADPGRGAKCSEFDRPDVQDVLGDYLK